MVRRAKTRPRSDPEPSSGSPPTSSGLPAAWIVTCFLLSGAAGLIYEVAWSKELSYLLGTSLAAVSTVVTSFLAGLAIGAATLGVRLGRSRQPVRAYGWLELGIAVAGVASIPVLRGLDPLLSVFAAQFGAASIAFNIARVVVVLVILAMPAVLMGATLPALVGHLERRSVGRGLAWLYAINTAGAVAGSLLAGFVLVPELGLTAATWVAAGLNLAAGTVAILARGRVAAPDSVPEQQAVHATVSQEKTSSRLAFAWAFGLSGFAALVLQIAWVRLFGLLFGSSVYSFAAVLAVYLAGIAAGGALGSRLMLSRRPMAAWGMLELGIAGAAAASLQLLPWIPEWFLRFSAYPGASWSSLMVVKVLLTASMAAVPSVLLGVAFPLGVRLLQRTDGVEAIGVAYAVNTAGTVVGSLAAGFWLLPWLGVPGTQILAASVSLTVGLGALALQPRGEGQKHDRWVAAACAAALVALVVVAPKWDPALMTAGVFRAQQWAAIGAGPNAAGGWTRLADAAARRRIVFYREGHNGSVCVETDSTGREFAMSVGGKVDASTLDMVTQVSSGLLPIAIARPAAQTLVIGLGSGVTVSSALAAGAGEVEVVELEQAVVEGARFFHPRDSFPIDDPRVRLVVDDGRTHLRHSPRRYDAIISEPSNPWLAGVNNLFTAEFFRSVRDHLAPDGVFCQWIQVYEVSPETLGSLLAAFLSAFPDGHAFLIQEADLLLIAAPPERRLDLSRLSTPAARREIERARLLGPEALAAFYRAPIASLAPMAAGAIVNRDDRPIVEYRAPREMLELGRRGVRWSSLVPDSGWHAAKSLFADWTPESWWTNRVQQRMRHREAAAARSAVDRARAEGHVALADRLGEALDAADRVRDVGERHRRAREAMIVQDFAEAELQLAAASSLEPENGRTWVLLADARRSMLDFEGAREAAMRGLAAERVDDRADAAIVLGLIELDRDQGAAAIARFREAQAIRPKHGEAYRLEGMTRVAAGDLNGARDACARGLAAAPGDPGLIELERTIAGDGSP